MASMIPPGGEESSQSSGYDGNIGGCHVADTDEHDCGGENAEKADQIVHSDSLRHTFKVFILVLPVTAREAWHPDLAQTAGRPYPVRGSPGLVRGGSPSSRGPALFQSGWRYPRPPAAR